MTLTRHFVLLTAIAGAACTRGTEPNPLSDEARRRAPNVGQLQIALGTLPPSVAAGDVVRLVAVAHNPTDATVDIGYQCGPPLAFEVTAPSGARLHPIPLDIPYTCERLDVHDVEPGETDSVAVDWTVPAATGRYQVRAGVRVHSALEWLTAARALVVR